MNVIVKRSILYYCDKYPLDRIALLTWYHEFSKHDFGLEHIWSITKLMLLL